MKNAIVTGAAGFTGYALVKNLIEHGYRVYALVRPSSANNMRISKLRDVHMVECDLLGKCKLSHLVSENCDLAFHLACVGERYDFDVQRRNIDLLLYFMDELKNIGCKRIVCTGSQAEYGVKKDIITEDSTLAPFCAYGAAKVASCFLSKNKAESIGMEWIWARIFSLYGINEPESRMLPALIKELKAGNDFHLSSCKQYWDYLNVIDGAEALISLAEKGMAGEIYNVASGDYRLLKDYVETVREIIGSDGRVIYGDDPEPFVSLRPDVSKIMNDTGWSPKISFEEGIRELL